MFNSEIMFVNALLKRNQKYVHLRFMNDVKPLHSINFLPGSNINYSSSKVVANLWLFFETYIYCVGCLREKPKSWSKNPSFLLPPLA